MFEANLSSAPPPSPARKIFLRLAARYIIPATAPPAGIRLGFDVETDGLLNTATRSHCSVVVDLDSDRIDEFGPKQIDAALARLSEATYLTGHNIVGFDLPVLQRLYGWAPRPDCTIVDTLIASRLILANIADLDDQAAAMGDAKLGKLRGRHSLEAWGARLGIPKIGADINDWAQWTPEMQERCVGDARLTKALSQFLQPDGQPAAARVLEHSVSWICERITADGIPFDRGAAEALRDEWAAQRNQLELRLQQQFPQVTNLNSRQQIARLLEERGWIPEERTEKTKQPKINDEILEDIIQQYPEFDGLADHYIIGRRLGQLVNGNKAWLSHIQPDGRIHGGLLHIGTPHHRAKHLDPNLAQVPNPKKGKPLAGECRALFRAGNGWVFVTCDQAGLQDRAFAHYLAAHDSGAYARAFVGGLDTHWASVQALGLVPAGTARNKEDRYHSALREGAKSFRYGFLFGAQAKRAGIIIRDTVRNAAAVNPNSDLLQRFFGGTAHPNENVLKRVGGDAKNRFEAATPGLRQLRESLSRQADRYGWLPGLDGRRIPVRALYTVLNYAVTSAEAIICKQWLMTVYDELRERFRYGWDGDVAIVAWTHDEIACCCRPEIAKQVGEIMVRQAKAAGDHFEFKCPLDAEYKIGRSWAGEPLGGKSNTAELPETVDVSDLGIHSENVEQAVADADDPAALAEPGAATDDPLEELLDAKPGDAHDDDSASPPGQRLPWSTSELIEVPPGPEFEAILASLSAEDCSLVRPAEAPKGNGHGVAHTDHCDHRDDQHGREQRFNADYGDRESEQHAGKPYAPIRARLLVQGYQVTQTFPFTLPGNAEPLYYEDRYELRPGIVPTKDRPRKQSRYRHRVNGRDLSDTGPRRIIYHWPAILAAGRGATVFITEGPNKSNSLNQAGLFATAAPYHQWGSECIDALAGYHLIYLADHCNPLLGWDAHDNDPAARYAEDARKKLAQRAASFRIVPAAHLWKHLAPGARPIELGDDVKDWLELGGDPTKLLEILS